MESDGRFHKSERCFTSCGVIAVVSVDVEASILESALVRAKESTISGYSLGECRASLAG